MLAPVPSRATPTLTARTSPHTGALLVLASRPELLERWCSRRWAEDIVVTMKFTGETPDFDTVDEARRVAAAHGYKSRAKHFFNNKNELEIMLRL